MPPRVESLRVLFPCTAESALPRKPARIEPGPNRCVTRSQRSVQLVERNFHGDTIARKINQAAVSFAHICVIKSTTAARNKVSPGGSTVDERLIAGRIGTCAEEELIPAIRKPQGVVLLICVPGALAVKLTRQVPFG